MAINTGKHFFHLIRNEKVGGSIPLSGTNNPRGFAATKADASPVHPVVM